MEIKQLEYVQALAEYKSYTKAAKALYIAQPSLSQQIHKLEDEIGFLLFERSTRNVVLTDEGRYFCMHANRVLAEWANMQDSIGSMSAADGGVSLGVFMQAEYSPCMEIISEFNTSYPMAHLGISMGNELQMLTNLREMKIDCLIIRSIEASLPRWAKCIRLCNEDVAVLLNRNDPLTKKESIVQVDLNHHKAICERGSLTTSFENLQNYNARQKAAMPFPVACTETALLIPHLLSVPERYAFTTMSSVQQYEKKFPHIIGKRLADAPPAATYLITLPDVRRQVVRDFCSYIIDRYNKCEHKQEIIQ